MLPRPLPCISLATFRNVSKTYPWQIAWVAQKMTRKQEKGRNLISVQHVIKIGTKFSDKEKICTKEAKKIKKRCS